MGFHMPELIILIVVALLIFGPKKLPEMGSVVGKSIRAFRKGMGEIANPKDEETPDPTQQHSLPESNKELRGLADVPVTSEEIDADKRAH